ncbi:MAG: hypothetical protein RLZZ330_187 [Actinomycetota bacterium]|jgi:predicted amidophosphoribosyltransferase
MQKIFDLLEMKVCFGCSLIGDYFCGECKGSFVRRSIRLDSRLKLSVVGNQNPALMRAISAWKDRHLKKLTPIFAQLLSDEIPELRNGKNFQIVTPPVRKSAYRSRGFLPIADLAKELCRRNSNLLHVQSTLTLDRNINDQRTLSYKERKSNLHGAFSCSRSPEYPVIMLDDVVTSGATFLEMYRVLPSLNQPQLAIALASSHNLFGLKNHNLFS